MLADLKYAVRRFRKNPGFTAVAVLTLGLGIGANTAVFSAINALLLRALPVQDPGRLVIVAKVGAGVQQYANDYFPYPVYDQLHQDAKSLVNVAAVSYANRSLVAGDFDNNQATTVLACHASGNIFSVLGIAPALGRMMSAEDDRPGSPRPVIVLSYAYWKDHFAADPDMIGKTVLLDDVSCTIVGVAPSGFSGLSVGGANTDLWVPIQMIPSLDPGSKALQQESMGGWVNIIGRLQPGITSEQARAGLDVIYQRKQADFAAAFGSKWSGADRHKFLDSKIALQPGGAGFSTYAPFVTSVTAVLVTIAGLVLLVACANVASLLFARGVGRQHELAVRLALGAGRNRLIRQLLTESLLLAVMGCLLGLLFSRWGLSSLRTFLPANVAVNLDTHPDAHVLLFMVSASVVTGVLVGLIPALRFSKPDLVDALKDNAHTTSGGSRQRFNQALVAVQIAVSVCLLAGAGLFVQTLQSLKNVDTGFNRHNVLLFSVELDKKYDANRQTNLFKQVLTSLDSLPGVRKATLSLGGMPAGGDLQIKFNVPGYTPSPGDDMEASSFYVGPGYFEALGIPLLEGRSLEPKDVFSSNGQGSPAAAATAVISQTLAKKYFGNTDPIGRRLQLFGPQQGTLEIVGVAKDVKYASLSEGPLPELYLPYKLLDLNPRRMRFQVRTIGDPLALASNIPAALQRIDRSARIGNMRTLQDLLDFRLVEERVISQVASFFSGLALLLAGIGLYGLLAYSVARRTREIGVRMALGARPYDVLMLFMGQGLRLAVIGCAIGIAAALALMHLIASQLYGVSAADPFTLAGTALVLVLVALLACWLPARRATKVNPLIALRAE